VIAVELKSFTAVWLEVPWTSRVLPEIDAIFPEVPAPPKPPVPDGRAPDGAPVRAPPAVAPGVGVAADDPEVAAPMPYPAPSPTRVVVARR
jgi:hypothetical protein